jgi:hypothetical protein
MKTTSPGRKRGRLLRQAVFCAQPLQRTSFFAGRLLTAEDFITEQDYHREKQRRHNLHCHGYGVVDGLRVSIERGASRSSVVVGASVAIDLKGNEVHVCAPVKVPLPEASVTLQVGIRFAERFTGSILVPEMVGEPDTMPARVEEGYEVILEPLNVATKSPTASDLGALPLARVRLPKRRLATRPPVQSSACFLTIRGRHEQML